MEHFEMAHYSRTVPAGQERKTIMIEILRKNRYVWPC